MASKGLGKGLKALITEEFDFNTTFDSEVKEAPANQSNIVFELEIGKIRPNADQPRKRFDEDALKELADSIKIHGVLQPLVVKKESNAYSIVAGERRFRASQLAGLKTVPVILKDLDPKSVMEIALIENVQREDLNPMEVAQAYEKLINTFGITQNELGERVGKNRVTITNSLRLLKLPEEIREMVLEEKISAGHARALLGTDDETLMRTLVNRIVDENLSVRETEAAIKNAKKKPAKKTKTEKDIYLMDTEERLARHFMTKTNIKGNRNKGKIEINYQTQEELNRILNLLTLEEDL